MDKQVPWSLVDLASTIAEEMDGCTIEGDRYEAVDIRGQYGCRRVNVERKGSDAARSYLYTDNGRIFRVEVTEVKPRQRMPRYIRESIASSIGKVRRPW